MPSFSLEDHFQWVDLFAKKEALVGIRQGVIERKVMLHHCHVLSAAHECNGSGAEVLLP